MTPQRIIGIICFALVIIEPRIASTFFINVTPLESAVFAGLLGYGITVCLIFIYSIAHKPRNDTSKTRALVPARNNINEPSKTTKSSYEIVSLAQTPDEFEHEVAKLIESLANTRTQVIGGSGDGGIDVKIYSEQGYVIGVVQCKFYKSSKTIPPIHIRALNSARHYAHANYAYFVTTGRFSDATHLEAQDLGVTLIDGERLDRICMKLENPFSELVH